MIYARLDNFFEAIQSNGSFWCFHRARVAKVGIGGMCPNPHLESHPMDLGKAIQQLRIEMESLDRAISSMEALIRLQENAAAAVMKRRGRREMGPEERQKVSERIKRYWADRRNLSSK